MKFRIAALPRIRDEVKMSYPLSIGDELILRTQFRKFISGKTPSGPIRVVQMDEIRDEPGCYAFLASNGVDDWVTGRIDPKAPAPQHHVPYVWADWRVEAVAREDHQDRVAGECW